MVSQYEILLRIEQKLDILISALAQEEEIEEPQRDLDGNVVPAERKRNDEL